MNFGEALELVKQGKLVTREGWNGKGMFIFQRPSDKLDISFAIDKVKSLPLSVKDYLQTQKDQGHYSEGIYFTPYLCMKNAQGEIMNGWAATQTDMLAEDWQEFII